MSRPLEHLCGDTLVRFPHDPASGRTGLSLVPAALRDALAPARAGRAHEVYDAADPSQILAPARSVDSLVQLKFAGEPGTGGFAQGHTLRDAPGNDAFRLGRQDAAATPEGSRIVTRLHRDDGVEIEHRLDWHAASGVGEVTTTLRNGSSTPLRVEMLTSFVLGDLSPFAADDAPGRLRVHRFRSAWSAEGRLETRSIEELHLERSWSGSAALGERFGQVGSLPVRRWFPFVALEDTSAGATWGTQLLWAGSWQLEVFRRHDQISLSGGLADREFGHWLKELAPGESLEAPRARIACVRGGLDELCDRFLARQAADLDGLPAVERDLPIIFNEFCTTWGDPREEKLLRVAHRLQGTPVRYLVIDAGWYKRPGATWANGHGDWLANPELFPRGLAATADAIRAHGLVPGLWFEMETCGRLSDAFNRTSLLLARDGAPVTAKGRRFWDLNNPAALAYLEERVFGTLEAGRFGYVKIDYNETIGIGCDGAESLGEGLRRQTLGTYALWDRLAHRLPDLVVENCASGGHRLEPSMLARSAMSSFSDAHELPEIPIIAAALQRLVPARQSQIWAVLRRHDSERRLVYSLAATFLGRMCLSGDIADLAPAQWAKTEAAMALYTRVAPILRDGVSRRFGETGPSWRHPRGWQAVLRRSEDGSRLLIVIHAFAEAPPELAIPLPGEPGAWRVVAELKEAGAGPASLNGKLLRCATPGDFSARVIELRLTRSLSASPEQTPAPRW